MPHHPSLSLQRYASQKPTSPRMLQMPLPLPSRPRCSSTTLRRTSGRPPLALASPLQRGAASSFAWNCTTRISSHALQCKMGSFRRPMAVQLSNLSLPPHSRSSGPGISTRSRPSSCALHSKPWDFLCLRRSTISRVVCGPAPLPGTRGARPCARTWRRYCRRSPHRQAPAPPPVNRSSWQAWPRLSLPRCCRRRVLRLWPSLRASTASCGTSSSTQRPGSRGRGAAPTRLCCCCCSGCSPIWTSQGERRRWR
mmetsp:Transcript_3626/g.8555  ORF Transcript_3626/g.8555 Transcript_3626/m.8555 type:complete len:253 (+) Transcript_3626:474-1232(+)